MDAVAAPAMPGSVTTVIDLGNKPFSSPYTSIGTEICQNLYLEIAQSEFSKAGYFLVKIPGLRRMSSAIAPTNLGACRGMITNSAGRTFSVHGNGIYEIDHLGVKTLRGNLTTVTGPVGMADNGSLLMLVDGISGWILRYSDNNWTRISDSNFPSGNLSLGELAPTHVVYLDSYFIVNVPNTNQYLWSNSFYAYLDDVTEQELPYDPAHTEGYWTPLQSGLKIGTPDNIAAIINCNNYLWILGFNRCEVHYDSGDYNGQQFKRYQGAILNIGCSSPYSVAVYQNNLFFLGTDQSGTLGVFTNDGMNPLRISTRGIEQMIQAMGDYSDCRAFTYAQNGHSFYVMQFPSGNRTFVYDTVTNAWHERNRLDAETGLSIRWDGMYATGNFDRNLIGDVATSEIYNLDQYYYQNDNPLSDGVNYIRCVKTTPIGFNLGKNIRYNWVQVIANQGFGTSVNTVQGVGQNPTLQIAWSNDCGVTYSNERAALLGRQGEYQKRSLVLACGMGRNRVWRIAMTDPVPFLLVTMLVNGSPCRF